MGSGVEPTVIDLDRLERLVSSRSREPLVWERKNGRVFQGSHLGQTLIALDDTYEDSQVDCEFIEAACEALPALVAEVRNLRKKKA